MAMNHQVRKQSVYPLSALLGCVLVIGKDQSANASSSIERALVAYENGHYQSAFKMIKTSADRGNAQAQHLLGVMYRKGLGVDPDEFIAFEWCRQVAENGLLEAQFQLGLMYLQGEGVTEDEDAVQEWLWMATDRGYPQASEVLQFIFLQDFTVGC